MSCTFTMQLLTSTGGSNTIISNGLSAAGNAPGNNSFIATYLGNDVAADFNGASWALQFSQYSNAYKQARPTLINQLNLDTVDISVNDVPGMQVKNKIDSAFNTLEQVKQFYDDYSVPKEPVGVVGGLAEYMAKMKSAGKTFGELADKLPPPASVGMKAMSDMMKSIYEVVPDSLIERLRQMDAQLNDPKGFFLGQDMSTPAGQDCIKRLRDATFDELSKIPGLDLSEFPDPTERNEDDSEDPLVIDLDGDGVELTERGNPTVFFDFAEEGIGYDTAWVSPDDGIVVRDADGDGTVNSAEEFFGDSSTDAFTDLATYDENADGQIDHQDAVWSQMRVWRDLNQDGTSQTGELMSMAEAGVAKISLDRVETDLEVAGSNVAAIGSWTGTDGVDREAWAVFFNVSTTNSRIDVLDGNTPVSPSIIELPYLAGGGRVPNLWLAMVENPVLETEVQYLVDNAATLTGSEMWEGMVRVVSLWLGAAEPLEWSEVVANPNSREVLVPLLEAFFDRKLLMPTPFSPSDIGATFTTDVRAELFFRNFVDQTMIRFLDQIPEIERERATTDEEIAAAEAGPYSAVAYGTQVNTTDDTTEGRLSDIVYDILLRMPEDRLEAMRFLDQAMPSVRAYRVDQYGSDFTSWFPDYVDSPFRDKVRQVIDIVVERELMDPFLADFAYFRLLAEYWGEGTDGADVLDPVKSKFGTATGRDISYYYGREGDDLLVSKPYIGPLVPEAPDTPGTFDIVGSQSATLIVYARGDGDDIVDLTQANGRHFVFLPDIASTEAVFRVSPDGGGNFIVTFEGGGSITFLGLGSLTNGRLELRYADGIVQDQDDVRLQYTDFDDIVTGDGGANVVTGGLGDDTLQGESGDDVYIYNLGDGEDRIREVYETVLDTETGQILRSANELWLQNVNRDEIIIGRESNVTSAAEYRNMTITFVNSPDDKIIIENQFRVSFSGGLPQPRIDTIRFADGSTINFAEASASMFASLVGDGDDVATGSNTNDIMVFSAGNDTLTGQAGDDVYIRNAGTPGDDVIDENGNAGDHEILVLYGLTPADVALSRDGNHVDLTLPIGSVRIDSQMGTGGQHRVEEIRFVPVTGNVDTPSDIWTAVDIARMLAPVSEITNLVEGTDDPETVNGTSGNDIIDGLAGDDILRGRFGSDIYRWGEGSGNDLIRESGELDSRSVDRLELIGLNPEDVEFQRIPGNELTVTIFATGEVLTVENHFSGPKPAIEFVLFADGTEWGPDAIAAAAWWRGGTEDDTITATSNSETIDGGPGADTMNGQNGDDIYLLRPGSGADTIIDRTYGNDDAANILSFEGVGEAELDIWLDGTSSGGLDAIIQYGPGDFVRLVNQFDANPDNRPIQFLVFNGGAPRPASDFFSTEIVRGTINNDLLTGTSGADIIDALQGNDTIQSSQGDDIYIWGRGMGNDSLREVGDGAPSNGIRLVGLNRADVSFDREPGSEDLRITILDTGEVFTVIDQFGPWSSTSQGRRYFGIERVEFADGSALGYEEILQAAPIIVDATSGTGSGRRGDDGYIWGPGRGDAVIDDDGLRTEQDVLVLDGLLPDDVTIRRGPADDALGRYHLLIEIIATGETLTLLYQLRGDDVPGSLGDPIRNILFSDGSRLETAPLDYDMPFLGTDAPEEIDGDILDNQIEGAGGDDSLDGSEGGDRYIWSPGDGNDIIAELTSEFIPGGEEDEEGGTSIVVPLESDGDSLFLKGVASADVTFSRDPAAPDDLLVTIGSETLRIVGQFASALAGVESVEASDRTWSAWEINQILGIPDLEGTAAGETLTGTWGADNFDPLAGDDLIETRGGNDRILIRSGGGTDTIVGFKGGPLGTIIELAGTPFADFEELLAAIIVDGNDLVIDLGAPAVQGFALAAASVPAGNDALILKDTLLSDLQPENFGFAAAPVTGTDLDDRLAGKSGGGAVVALAGDDSILLFGSASHDVDGGEGSDVVELPGQRSAYDLQPGGDPNSFSLVSLVPGLPSANLTDVETLVFGDVWVDLTAAEFAPVLNSIAPVEIDEDTPLSGFLPFAFDPDEDGFTYVIDGTAPDGFALDSDGSFTYLPPLDFFGAIEVSYLAIDTTGLASDPGTFSIVVVPVNDAPCPAEQGNEAEVEAGETLAGSVPAATDPENSPEITYALTGDVPPGLTFLSDGSFTYTPGAGDGPVVSFFYVARDVEGAQSDPVRFDISIAGNEAPVAAADGNNTAGDEDSVIAGQIPAATDPDGDTPLTYALEGDPIAGLTLNPDGSFEYIPPADFNGSVSFSYVVSDPEGATSDPQSFSIDVQPVNDAPVLALAIADQEFDEDTPILFSLPADSFTDVDGDSLTLSAQRADGSALPAWLSFDPDSATFSGTPDQDFNGSIEITVTASDGSLAAAGTFVLEILPVNDAPILANAIADQAFDEDMPVLFSLPANSFSDVDGDSLTLSAARADGSALPAWLSFDPGSGSFSGTPDANFNGSLEIAVTASDGNLAVSDTFVLDILPVNDAPILVNALADRSFDEDTEVNFVLPGDAFSDPDGDSLTLTAALVGGAALPGWLSFDAANRAFAGTPPADFNGALEIEVRASDGTEAASARFTLDILAVNDAPTALDDNAGSTGFETPVEITAASLLANDSDPDGDPLSIVAVSDATGGTATLDSNGDVLFTPNAGFSGEASFRYIASDGAIQSDAIVVLTVEPGDETNPYEGWVTGTTGRDFLRGSLFRENQIYGDDGNDIIIGGWRDDQLAGGAGRDRLFGLSGRDSLEGNDGNDFLFGGRGNDELSGGPGRDVLFGGQGTDVFVYNTGDGADHVKDFAAHHSPYQNWHWRRPTEDIVRVDVDGVETFGDLMGFADQTRKGVSFDFGDGDELILYNTRIGQLEEDNFVFGDEPVDVSAGSSSSWYYLSFDWW